MTRKHFQMLATDLGLKMRSDADTPFAVTEAQVGMLFETADSLSRMFPAFRVDTFINWALDVANGVRDAQGRKVA